MAASATNLASDAELIDRLRNGDEAAFTWLVDTDSPSLKRLALGFRGGGSRRRRGRLVAT